MNKPLKWHGGKHYLAKDIIALFPPRDGSWCHYVEPYFGGGSVLLANDPKGISEVANDLDSRLTNFWRCIGDIVYFEYFHDVVKRIPFSEVEFAEATQQLKSCDHMTDPYEMICVPCAVAFFIACRQSLAGRMQSFAPLSRNRTRRGMNEQASAWLECISGLRTTYERLQRVVILNRDAVAVIAQQDGPKTLFYVDPPYVQSTRETPEVYLHELAEGNHHELLRTLAAIKGRFLLSGYPNQLYKSAEDKHGWKCHRFDVPNNAAGGERKRIMTECVWTNY